MGVDIISPAPLAGKNDTGICILRAPAPRVAEANSDSLHDMIHAATTLLRAERLCVAPISIYLRHNPDPTLALSQLPLTLELEISYSLNAPAIYEDLRDINGLTADAQRRFLSFIFPSPRPEKYTGVTDIKYFFSSLTPAPSPPDLTPKELERRVQHPKLTVDLLPFQQRSVWWLLEREGMTLDAQGTVIPKKERASDGRVSKSGPMGLLFWDAVEDPSGRYVGFRIRVSFSTLEDLR